MVIIKLDKLFYWAFCIFIVYLAFEIVRKLTGGSLGFEDLVIGLLIANLGYSFYLKESVSGLEKQISEHVGWHKGREHKK